MRCFSSYLIIFYGSRTHRVPTYLLLSSPLTGYICGLGKRSIEKKRFLSGIAQIGLTPPSPAGQQATWSFFRPSKTTFKRVLRNQIPIENDDENGDDNGDNFDA